MEGLTLDGIDFSPKAVETKQQRWPRGVAMEKFTQASALDAPGVSLAQIARYLDVPPSTLRYWRKRKTQLDGDPVVLDFLESPSGLAWIHRLIGALHLVFGQASSCGIRQLCLFLELTQLDQVVATSFGSQRQVAAELEGLLVEFGQQQEQKLRLHMPTRQITACIDETFHPEICLVAIEPVSNYLLLETYVAARDQQTWDASMQQALQHLSVEVVQCTGDQARALVAHTQQTMSAHYSPDVFHVQQDVSRATSCRLAQQTKDAWKRVEEAERQLDELRENQAACRTECPQSEYVQQKQTEIEQTAQRLGDLQETYQSCRQRQTDAAEARRGISSDYHPFDLDTAKACDQEEVARRLNQHFDRLDATANEAKLSESSLKKLAKARRVLPQMVATIAFFWSWVQLRLNALAVPQDVRETFIEQVLPGYYFERLARRATTAEQRHKFRIRSQQLLERARAPTSPWMRCCDQVTRQQLECCAQQCADLFQRSSSCVEGRNGQLSLRHHALHRLSSRKLASLRVLHNYFVTRVDGTTAAERFFGRRPDDLFEWLLDRLSLPTRPAQRRRAG
jgi:hypothetical protein